MEIKRLGEFGLIERIRHKFKAYPKDVIKGIGDDTAVIEYDKMHCLLFTTDSLVEDVHFSLEYFSPVQIGMKAIEQNVSDIASMGGIPKYALVSLGLPNATKIDFIDKLCEGISRKSKAYRISIVGGNIAKSKKIFVCISMAGIAEKKHLALRSNARIEDLIFCSGNLGGSAAGLELLKRHKKGNSIKKHLEPNSRLALARKLVKIGVNSMIDISDGIASELRHICSESKTGAVIHADKIPVSKDTIFDSKKVGKNPLELALYGGEDYELMFTAGKKKISKLKKYDVHVIGEILDKRRGIILAKGNKKYTLGKGFEHFKNK